MSEFSECTHGRTLNTCPVCRDTMRGYKELVEVQQARIEEIIEDIRMACGCTDGDDIRNHLAEYLEVDDE